MMSQNYPITSNAIRQTYQNYFDGLMAKPKNNLNDNKEKTKQKSYDKQTGNKKTWKNIEKRGRKMKNTESNNDNRTNSAPKSIRKNILKQERNNDYGFGNLSIKNRNQIGSKMMNKTLGNGQMRGDVKIGKKSLSPPKQDVNRSNSQKSQKNFLIKSKVNNSRSVSRRDSTSRENSTNGCFNSTNTSNFEINNKNNTKETNNIKNSNIKNNTQENFPTKKLDKDT